MYDILSIRHKQNRTCNELKTEGKEIFENFVKFNVNVYEYSIFGP